MSPGGASERDVPHEAGVSAPAPVAASAAPVPQGPMPAPEREAREPAPPREYHAEPREPAPPHEPAPLAHFEPAPKPDGGERGKPYVVWSPTPTEKDGSDPEE